MNHHPQGCQCSACRERPCSSLPISDAFLLPRIIGSGRETSRRICQCLVLSGLSDCVVPPLCLLCVEQSGTPVIAQKIRDRCQRNTLVYRLEIPVCAQVRDAAGCVYTAFGTVEAEAALTTCERNDECKNCQVIAFADVRLANCPPPSNCPSFEAAFDVRVEIYLVRYEPFRRNSGCEPPRCPELPLFPHLPGESNGLQCRCERR